MTAETQNPTNENSKNGTLVEGTKRIMTTGKNGYIEEKFIPAQIRVYPAVKKQQDMIMSC